MSLLRLKDLELTEEQLEVLDRLKGSGILDSVDFNEGVDWENCIADEVAKKWISLSRPEIVVKRAKELFFVTMQSKINECVSIRDVVKIWELSLTGVMEEYRYRVSGERFIKSGLPYCMRSDKEV